MKPMTPNQRKVLFRMIRPAAFEAGEDPEVYRKRIMKEELGVEHLSEVSSTTGYDRLMSRISRDSGDDASAIKYALAATGRVRRLIMEAAEKIAPGNALGYVAGVLIQARMVRGCGEVTLAARLASDFGWTVFTARQLRQVLAILKVHLRRRE